MTALDAVDLFAGPGGWDVGAQALGLHVLGSEKDENACRTRRANDLPTIEGDVRELDPLEDRFDAPGLIASPPCQTFSTAGSGSGRRAMDDVLAGVETLMEGWILPVYEDERTALVLEPLRWILARHRAGRPFEWIVLEQVPNVLPVWKAYAIALATLGYSAKAATLSAEEYGVPQTRKRAILVARLGALVEFPTPTHTRYRHGHPQAEIEPGRLPWVSMADALTWGILGGSVETGQNSRVVGGTVPYSKSIDAPSPTVTGQTRSWRVRSNYGTGGDPANRGERSADEPSATITSKAGRNVYVPTDAPEDSEGPWAFAGAGAAARKASGQVPRGTHEPAHTVTGGQSAAWVPAGSPDASEEEWAYRNGNQANSAVRPVTDPAPTAHFGARGNDVRFVSNAQANATVRRGDEPAPTIMAAHDHAERRWEPNFADQSGTETDHEWPENRPSTTVAGRGLVQNPGATANRFNGSTKSRNDGVRVTPQEAAILQTFPPDFVWEGTKTSVFQQIGNAVPCLLAYRVLQAVHAPPEPHDRGELF